MALTILTTQELTDIFKANFEGELNQDAPPVDIAFLKVISVIEAMIATGLYKYAADRAKANLALTASEDDLELIGKEFNVIRKQAESAVFTITLPGTDGTLIPATVSFIGDSNGARYIPDASDIIAGGIATLSVAAEVAGVSGNLNVGETMSISVQIAGAETVATITVIDNVGAEEEDLEVYRSRVLFAIRGTTGGGNSTDYKIWSEEVAGVKRAYPFAGRPVTDLSVSYPADRTIYIEAETSIDSDGIPPQALLDEVRFSVSTNPASGDSRPPLGLEDSILYVEPIIRTSIFIEITGLSVSSGLVVDAKTDLELALSTYLLTLVPFVDGIDFEPERNDLITGVTLSSTVNSVLKSYGGSAKSVFFGTASGSFVSEYQLNQNELTKSGGFTYAS